MSVQSPPVADAPLQSIQLELPGREDPGRWSLEISLKRIEPPKMTYDEFLEWADEDTYAEWVNGEVIMTSPASDRQQDIADYLTSVMRIFVQVSDLGVVRSAPFQMKLENGREPDLLFVRREHMERLHETYLEGPADLAIEIMSPESAGRDRGEKFFEYARGGVPEYWLIDPQQRWAEFYQLEEGHYVSALSGKSDKYTSLVLPSFWLQVEWLWQDPLPSPIQTLAKIVNMDPSISEAFERALKAG